MLDECCPFCEIVKTQSQSSGEYCAKGTYTPPKILNQPSEAVIVIVLKEHTDIPTTEAMVEAAKMAEGSLAADIRDVSGHWGMKIFRPDWVQKPKASTKAGPDGQVYDSLK